MLTRLQKILVAAAVLALLAAAAPGSVALVRLRHKADTVGTYRDIKAGNKLVYGTLKADINDKANAKTTLDYIDAELAKKADASDLVTVRTDLATKADQAALASLAVDVSRKADVKATEGYIKAQLRLKADQSALATKAPKTFVRDELAMSLATAKSEILAEVKEGVKKDILAALECDDGDCDDDSGPKTAESAE
jgi:hypothetical protein